VPRFHLQRVPACRLRPARDTIAPLQRSRTLSQLDQVWVYPLPENIGITVDRDRQDRVRAVAPGSAADGAGLKAGDTRAGRILGLDELLILNSLWQDRRLATAAAARLIQKPKRDARSVLERLVEAGLVEARGTGQGRSYHLSAATYRQLADEAASVRLRGFEPL
jgi:ATP-dependent DNA helicase RecG